MGEVAGWLAKVRGEGASLYTSTALGQVGRLGQWAASCREVSCLCQVDIMG
jgi:hypothetical protein